MLMVPLERPVLSLAIDAVVKVDGEDALCGLLTLFCKCKSGLQDGDRLENMAWRLWHVERSSSPALSSPVLAASPLTSSSSSSSEGDSDVSSEGETWDHDQTTTLCGATDVPNPALEASLTPSAPPHGRTPLKGTKKSRRQSSSASTASRTLSSCRRPSLSSRRTHSNTSIGQIMADLLPDKLAVYGAKRVPSQGIFGEDSLTLHSSSGEVTPVIVIPSPEAALKQPQPQSSSPPRPQLDRSMRFPTVVIVNPTPHPTPPVTPQVSPPPTSPPRSAGAFVGQMPKRDTLAVFTRLPTSHSANLPLTPESIEQKTPIEDRPTQSSHRLPETNGTLLPPASGPKSEGNGRPAGAGVGRNEGLDARLGPADPKASANEVATNKSAGKGGNVIGGGSFGTRLGASLNPPERKFFIAQVGSPDGDSPETSASSQVGSQSALSVSMATSSMSDQKATTAGCDPASVASRASASTARSHSSGGSSSRSGLRMKSRKSAAPVAKGKGKDARHGHGHGHGHGAGLMQRSHSGGRGHIGLTGGTIQRSKVGGRTAAAIAVSLAGASPFVQMAGAHAHHAAPVGTAARHHPPPSPLRPTAEVEKTPRSSSKLGRTKSKSPARSSSVARQHRASATQVNGKGAIARAGSVSGSKAIGQEPPASSSKQPRLEFADDSDFTEDEEWDTEDGSEEAERTSEEHEHDHPVMTEADRKIAEAVAEAQRQRDLFAKVDRRSYTNLNRARSGLLTSIFHPDPEKFPPDHLYRQTRSTQDILAPMTRPLYPAIPMQPTRSAAAVPVAATVTAHGVGSPDAGRRRSPLRLKGRPEDVEESDSGEEDEENKVQISASVAEQRLAALHKGKRPAQPSQLSQQQQQQYQQLPQRPPPPQRQNTLPAAPPTQGALYSALADAQNSQLGRVATAPIPLGLGYPYNLPPPMPPSTPRTTRRNMLTHELSESLRRNLLWERQVSKQRPIGLGRRVVTGTNGGPSAATNGNGANGNGTQNGGPPVSADELRRQTVLARNRSWADNYHAAGW